MPITPTYPGVYIEEAPSGVHSITGVQTSVTAFLGPTRYGPTDKALLIHSFADFQRKYGGLDTNSPMSFAVSDFFLNGGSDAVIARVYKAKQNTDGHAVYKLTDKVKLKATDPGEWGNHIAIGAQNDIGPRQPVDPKAPTFKTFTLTIELRDENGKALFSTVHRGVTLDPKGPRRLDRVLERESDVLTVDGDLPDERDTVPENIDLKRSPPDADVKGEDSDTLAAADLIGGVSGATKTGLHMLDAIDLFNLLCIPPLKLDGEVPPEVIAEAVKYCHDRRAMLIVDPPLAWSDKDKVRESGITSLMPPSENAAVYFPRIKKPNPLNGGKIETFVPCGAVAGVMAKTDADRGVWKAPAGSDAKLFGISELQVKLNNAEHGELNPLGINCLRSFPDRGMVVWGARTTTGADSLASEWKYVPIRRLALFLEETLFRSTSWVVFEPNDEPLWAQIRLNIGAFMHRMFRQGAFAGSSPKDAYFVKCDADTTPQEDRDLGIVNIHVGFAPLKPAEFVVISFRQMTGQLQV
jgi:phage tail sheath protein FI